MSELSTGTLVLLGVFVYFAGLVDALAGGGGLITLPAYLSLGVDPRLVLGTNKLVSSIGTTAATINYFRTRKTAAAGLLWPIAAALVGGYLGARLALLLDAKWLRWMMLALIPTIAYAVHSHHDFGRADESHLLTSGEKAKREAALGVPLGVYDGFFGPGTGTFFALGFSRFCGYDLVNATARAKALNLATNVSALAGFLLAGRVHVKLGLAMALMSILGNYTGSHLGLKRGAGAIRPAVLLVCAGLFLKLLYDAVR